MSVPDGWFILRGQPADQTLPPTEERYSKFGEALDRALDMASATAYRSVMVTDLQGVVYVTLSLLWTLPRELR